MSENLTLTSDQFQRMLHLVVAEQERLKDHLFWFRIHKGAFYFLVASAVVFGLGIIGEMPEGTGLRAMGEALYTPGLVAFQIASFILGPLFLMNLRFAWALHKQDRLRRRLGIQTDLQRMLRTSPKRRWIMTVAAVVTLIVALIELWSANLAFGWEGKTLPEVLNAIFTPLCVVIVGLSIPVLWWTARGEDRLRAISSLQERLAQEQAAEDSSFSVSLGDYDQVARLEKRRAIQQRADSVRRGAKLTSESIYAVQRSYEVQEAIMRLDPKSRLAVEETIFALMNKPKPRRSSLDPASKIRSIRVGKTAFSLRYEVEKEEERIRIHELRESSDEGGRKGKP